MKVKVLLSTQLYVQQEKCPQRRGKYKSEFITVVFFIPKTYSNTNTHDTLMSFQNSVGFTEKQNKTKWPGWETLQEECTQPLRCLFPKLTWTPSWDDPEFLGAEQQTPQTDYNTIRGTQQKLHDNYHDTTLPSTSSQILFRTKHH